jgi:hypothetical protein
MDLLEELDVGDPLLVVGNDVLVDGEIPST